MASKRRLNVPDKKAKPDQQNGDREQLSLVPGGAEYRRREAVKDGLDPKDFITDDATVSEGDDKRPDEVQEAPAEPEHTAELAETLSREAQIQRQKDGIVARNKYRLQMAKANLTHQALDIAAEIAAETPCECDDLKVQKAAAACKLDLPDVLNDGVSQDEYVSRSIDRYCGG